MKHIKKTMFLTSLISSLVYSEDTKLETKTTTHQKASRLPFGLELSLDIIGLELDHYQKELKNNWGTNLHAEVIIEEAEILVQTATTQIQPVLKTKIIDLFLKHGLHIRFDSDNKIITLVTPPSANTTNTAQSDDSDDSDIEKEMEKKKRIKQPKPHKHKPKEAKQIFAPKKIHGARRTMNRLKREAAERAKKAREEIQARIDAKKDAVLKAQKQDLISQETHMREHIMLEHAKLQEKMLEEFKKNLGHTNSDDKLLGAEHL